MLTLLPKIIETIHILLIIFKYKQPKVPQGHEKVLCLKGTYDVAKNKIMLCIWYNAMCLCGLRFKNTYFSTYRTLLFLLYAPPF